MRRDARSLALDEATQRLASSLGGDGQAVLACDPSLEGVMAAIGVGYLAHADERCLRLAATGSVQPRLGEACVDMPGTAEEGVVDLARRVYASFRTRCGATCATRVMLASAVDDSRMPETLHRYVRLGFACGHTLFDLVADERTVALARLARYTLAECERTRQFVRFSHLADGSWMARFEPKANTIPLTAQHFVRRMPTERFFIVDPVHHVAAFHQWGARQADLLAVEGALLEDLMDRGRPVAADEELARTLWRGFYDAVALPGRDVSQRGYDLRVSLMPKRFWGNLTELARP